MDVWSYAILGAVGLIAGFLNVMAGGGSLLTVPVMLFLGLPGPVANGTNRIAILAQNITAVTAFFRKGYADFRLSLTLSLCALPGAVAGAYLGSRLQGVWFNRTLAAIMLGVMLLMTFTKHRDHEDAAGGTEPKNIIIGHALMILVGCYGGFIQVGVGFIVMAVLHRVMRLNLVVVNMHKVFIVMTYTLAALVVFALRVDIMWLLGICLAVAYSIGAWLGVHMSISRGERLIRIILNSVLIIFIIKLLFF
jgi:uncharacterized membrane protein YfcA